MEPFNWRMFLPNKNQLAGLETRSLTEIDKGSAVYQGQWNPTTQEREGLGVQIWSDGSRYEGLWKNGMANGYGRLIHASGDVFEGDWLDDMANG